MLQAGGGTKGATLSSRMGQQRVGGHNRNNATREHALPCEEVASGVCPTPAAAACTCPAENNGKSGKQAVAHLRCRRSKWKWRGNLW